MNERRVAVATTFASCAVIQLATQLEWIRSGSASRNSYEMFRSAQRLGLDQLTPFRVIWFLLPVLCLGSVLMVSLARERVGAVFLAAASLISLGAGIAVVRSGLGAGPGAPLAVVSGVLGAVVAIAVVITARRSRRLLGSGAATSD